MRAEEGDGVRFAAAGNKAVRDVIELPWNGGSDDNEDYECLRAGGAKEDGAT